MEKHILPIGVISSYNQKFPLCCIIWTDSNCLILVFHVVKDTLPSISNNKTGKCVPEWGVTIKTSIPLIVFTCQQVCSVQYASQDL